MQMQQNNGLTFQESANNQFTLLTFQHPSRAGHLAAAAPLRTHKIPAPRDITSYGNSMTYTVKMRSSWSMSHTSGNHGCSSNTVSNAHNQMKPLCHHPDTATAAAPPTLKMRSSWSISHTPRNHGRRSNAIANAHNQMKLLCHQPDLQRQQRHPL